MCWPPQCALPRAGWHSHGGKSCLDVSPLEIGPSGESAAEVRSPLGEVPFQCKVALGLGRGSFCSPVTLWVYFSRFLSVSWNLVTRTVFYLPLHLSLSLHIVLYNPVNPL